MAKICFKHKQLAKLFLSIKLKFNFSFHSGSKVLYYKGDKEGRVRITRKAMGQNVKQARIALQPSLWRKPQIFNF